MFTKRFHLVNVLGFPVYADLSWFAIVILITWSLASGYFPLVVPDLGTLAYWGMGALGALGLFASILLHELGHAVVARRYDVPIRRITLFIFGGVAEMEKEPPSAKSEFLVAIAGPIVSVVLGLAFLGARAGLSGVDPLATGVVRYLGVINLVVVAFNLLPAFPLDGGRVLRSILWAWKEDLGWATRITSGIGSGFGIALIGLGMLAFISGNPLGGLWWALIGFFVLQAARMARQQQLLRRAFEGEPLERFLTSDPVTVPASATVREAVEDYIYRHHYKMLPVMDDGHLAGCLTTSSIREIPRERWDETRVADIVQPCTPSNTIQAGTDAMEALSIMSRNQVSRLVVLDGDRLAGVVSLKDMLRFLSTKMELEGSGPARRPRSRP